MNKIAAWLGCLWIGLLGALAAGESNEFKATIEGEACVVRAYEGDPGVLLPGWVDSKPKLMPQWQLAILFQHSNVAQHLNNDEVRSLCDSLLDDAEITKMRTGLGKMYEAANPSAADNPWKGMTQTLERAFAIESARGKCLLYLATSHLAGTPSNGPIYGALKWANGTYKLGKTGFETRSLKPISDEFLKLKAEGKIQAAPLDSLR